jgi:sulfate adenylyltransferase subunit 1
MISLGHETAHREHGLLRFATAGSVDDGKSTLVGRLLFDSKSVLSDTLAAAERTSAARGQQDVDLSLLVDGLRAEREQGITIDVAYRYFATDKRTFILADTPGHVQYTRNTVTGASTADLIIILVDARTGVVAQTRRHATVAALLGVPEILLAVNKIDLVGYDQAVFEAIASEFATYATGLGIPEVVSIPISALHGDNVVTRSSRIPWYTGPSVLEHLETVEVRDDRSEQPLRFPVQYVIRPGSDYEADPDYRGYAGRVASGTVRVGDPVAVLPGGQRTTVIGVDVAGEPRDLAEPGDSVTLRLADDIDIARGNLIADPGEAPTPVREFTATVTQVSDRPLRPGQRLLVKYGTTTTRAMIGPIDHLLDIDTLTESPAPTALGLNDIGYVTIRTAEALSVDPYQPRGAVGALLIIDPADGTTVAIGMVGDRRGAITGIAQETASRCQDAAETGMTGIPASGNDHDAQTPGP